METVLKQKFTTLWNKYFPGASLPVSFFYTENIGDCELVKPGKGHRCLMQDIERVINGESLAFDSGSFGCPGGKYFLGYNQKMRPDFEYFLSCGIPCKMEGERYKKSPEIAKEHITKNPPFEAPGKFIVFKRWDKLGESDNPSVVIFLAAPDILSGLFTLANYDVSEPAVIAPMGSGCSSIVTYPYRESLREDQKAVLGMFDVSARPSVPENVLTFAVPYAKFKTMADNMDESFLITQAWGKVKNRIEKQGNFLK